MISGQTGAFQNNPLEAGDDPKTVAQLIKPAIGKPLAEANERRMPEEYKLRPRVIGSWS